MVKVKLQFAFFDSAKVKSSIDRGEASRLSRAGAFIRRTAKGLIRSRKKVSAPGQAPSSHAGLLKDLIFFGLDANKRSVVIGPLKFTRRSSTTKSDSTVPGLLEAGGDATITRIRHGRVYSKRAKYSPRPYMAPALEKNRSKLPALWAGSVNTN